MTDNISRSGVLFRSPEKLAHDELIEMHFELPLRLERWPGAVVACRGHVVRMVPSETPDALPGLAATISRYRFVRRKPGQVREEQ